MRASRVLGTGRFAHIALDLQDFPELARLGRKLCGKWDANPGVSRN